MCRDRHDLETLRRLARRHERSGGRGSEEVVHVLGQQVVDARERAELALLAAAEALLEPEVIELALEDGLSAVVDALRFQVVGLLLYRL